MVNTKLFLAALIGYEYNCRILHWKVKGLSFDGTHAIMQGYYEKLSDMIDQVAELILMNPDEDCVPPSLLEAIQLLENSDREFVLLDTKKNYTRQEVFSEVEKMFADLRDLASAALPELSEDLKSVYDEFFYWLRVEGSYKIKQRLKA